MRLSPSTLNLFKDCPRCFWLEKNRGIKRPRGIFPSLPGGMDRIIKKSFDQYRAKSEILPGFGNAVLVESKRIAMWRNWRSGLSCKIEGTPHILGGALDDCLYFPTEQKYAPLDYKTRGSSVEDWAAYVQKYYQLQIDVYALLLEKNGCPTIGRGYFAFYYPENADLGKSIFQFNNTIVDIPTSVDNALATVKSALECLEKPMPEADPECEYCTREVKLNEIRET